MRCFPVVAMTVLIISACVLTLPFEYQSVRASFYSPLVIGTTDSVQSCLDPARAYDYFGWEIIQSLGCGLVEYKAGATGSIDDIIPSLATSWNVSDDGLVWTFNLRQGVHYDDGTELNATHVKYTFDRGIGIADPNGAFVAIGYNSIINNVTVTDKYVVKFCLKMPFSPFLSLLALPPSYMVDPAYAPPTSVVVYTEGDARASNPMGLGPYTLASWTRTAGKDNEMRLQANPNYWNASGGYPKTQNITMKFYADSTTLALAVNDQEVDVAYRQLGTTDINSMKNNTNLKVWEGPGLIQYLVLQEKYTPFNNTIIRQAVGAAINRTSLVNTVFLGDAQELYSMIPNGMFGHTDAFLTLGNPNYTKTRELLAPLGYNETNKLTFTLWFETSGHYPQSPQQALVLKSSLETSGVITVTLQGADWPSYRTHRQNEDMDAYILGWYPDYIDPDDYIQPFLDSSGGSWLHDNYNNTQMDQLIAWARGNTTADARSSLYSQIQNLMVEDCPIIPTYQGKTYAVTKPSVEGVCLDTSENLRFWLLYGSKTWIVDDIGPADFRTIQEAINAANPGDTILVAPGVYHDQGVVVNKTVTIIGEHGSGPVFDGGGSGQIFMSLSPGASGTVIQGLMITNYGQGIVVNASNCRIYDTMMSLMSQNGIALMGAGTGDNQIYGNMFQNNQIAVNVTASSTGNVVHDNIVSTNFNVGIDLESGGNIVCSNTVSGNHLGIRVTASGNTIYHNSIVSNVVQTGILASAVNTWDDGYPSGGNYWSDYAGLDRKCGPSQDHPGSDGIGDTPYTIDSNNTDNYPLMNPWIPPSGHNVAVISTVSSKTVIGQGHTGNLAVYGANRGKYSETFTVTVYANTTSVGSMALPLESGSTINITLSWNTTGFAKGNYTISAHAWPVPGETSTADNTFTGGWVVVSMVGDLTGGTPNPWDFVPDGKVSSADISVVARCFGSSPETGPPMRWEPNCDLNSNGHVDGNDVATVARHFGEADP